MGDITRRPSGLIRTHRDFRLLWAADAVSQFGTRIEGFALPMLALLVLNASTLQVGLLRTLETTAIVLIGLPAGAWCDRMRSRPVLIAADLARFAFYGSIPLAALFGVLGLGQIYVVVFVTGAISVFFNVAQRSWLPRLVGRGQLIEANTRLQGNQSAAAVSASALAGGIVQLLGAPVAVLTDAVSYLASALLLRRTRTPELLDRPPRRPLLTEIAEGLRFVLGHPVVRPIVLVTAGQILFQSIYNAVSTVFLLREVHLSPGLIGVLSSTAMLGALAATFTARPLLTALSRPHPSPPPGEASPVGGASPAGRAHAVGAPPGGEAAPAGGVAARALGGVGRVSKVGERRALWLGTVGMGVGMLLIPLTDPGWRILCYVLGDAVVGYSIILGNVVTAGLQQSACPDHLLGRMAATATFITRAVIPVGSILGGVLGTVLSLRPTIALAAVGTILTALILLTLPRLAAPPAAQRQG